MESSIILTVTPAQLDMVSHTLTALRDRLCSQEDSAGPLEAILAKRKLEELEPVEAVVFGELNKLYEPQRNEGVRS